MGCEWDVLVLKTVAILLTYMEAIWFMSYHKKDDSTVKREMLVAIIFGVLKISQFSKDLTWRYYWKKVVGVHIFFIWRVLILANFINLPILPNKSSPTIIYAL